MSQYISDRILKVIRSMCVIKPMSDEDALVEGIIVQNQKYEKLLEFVKKISNSYDGADSNQVMHGKLSHHQVEAFQLLNEIGE